MNAPYSISSHGSIQVLEVNSLLSEYENKQLLKVAQARIEEGFSNFVIDLSKMEYMNSVGLNFLISLKSRSKDSGGTIAVANASEKIKQLLTITKLTDMFYLTDTVEEAIRSFDN